jgi:multidrug efflux pump subunit AcrA (membrane-fusion protein)
VRATVLLPPLDRPAQRGLTEAYNPKMPADVVRLDYYGRELEIWAARNDLGRITTTRDALRRTWHAVKPNVISHGGAAAAARTDSLVARLDSAKTAKDYAQVATPFLDVVDELEKPFEK